MDEERLPNTARYGSAESGLESVINKLTIFDFGALGNGT
jgi:hypothetical protein